MTLLVILFLLLTAVVDDSQPGSVVQLFDGKSLQGWEITDFGPQGPVYIRKGSIILGTGEGCTGITYRAPFPKMNYEIRLQAKRIDGYDFFCGMTFPVDKDPCTLIVGGWGGTVVGLSSIDGLDASENNTGVFKTFNRNQWYDIRLRVTPDSIQAWIDAKKIVAFETGNHELSIRPEVRPSRPFGIASWNTTAALKNIQLIKIKK